MVFPEKQRYLAESKVVMSNVIKLKTPLQVSDIEALRIGDIVHITGTVYTARDAAHKRMIDTIDRGETPPFDVKGQVIYYVGPTPPKPGKVIGSAGPTTSYRMDPYTPRLLDLGLRATIGKGQRGKDVIEAMKEFKGVYLVAVGGAAALISKRIKEAEIIAYEDLGPEAIRRIYVEDFPAIVANDILGEDLFSQGKEKYKTQIPR